MNNPFEEIFKRLENIEKMIAPVTALEYDLAKEINGQAVATEIARHELYGCTGAGSYPSFQHRSTSKK